MTLNLLSPDDAGSLRIYFCRVYFEEIRERGVSFAVYFGDEIADEIE